MVKSKKHREQYDIAQSERHSWVHGRAVELVLIDGGLVDDAHWARRYKQALDEWTPIDPQSSPG